MNSPAGEAQPLTDEQIERHTILASQCPPDSRVLLVSSVRRLRAALASAPVQPTDAAEKPCVYCDGTGDIHRRDGEWMGCCPLCTDHRPAGLVDNTELNCTAVLRADKVAPAPSAAPAQPVAQHVDVTDTMIEAGYDVLKRIHFGPFNGSPSLGHAADVFEAMVCVLPPAAQEAVRAAITGAAPPAAQPVVPAAVTARELYEAFAAEFSDDDVPWSRSRWKRKYNTYAWFVNAWNARVRAAAPSAALVDAKQPEQPLGDPASPSGSLSLRSDDPYRSVPTRSVE